MFELIIDFSWDSKS